MPSTSPEAIARKSERRRQRRAARRAPFAVKVEMLPSHKIVARRMLPKLPDMTKAQLREMLTKAVENT